ncbi:MAG: hypothetical protein ACE5F2_02455 [Candidatus Paceibacteria bacterium]
MDELIFAGNKYISSKRAGKIAGYNTDYLGQMCRAGKMDCRFVGRNWYINEREIENQKKSFKKDQIKPNRAREIEYKKIELEPMYYSNDERSNYPEISKVIHNDIEEVEDNQEVVEEEHQVPLHIVKKYAPRSLQRQGRQIIRRQEIMPQQVSRRLSMALSLASVLILIGVLFTAGTFTLEQVIHYSSEDNAEINTSIQLANITKAL